MERHRFPCDSASVNASTDKERSLLFVVALTAVMMVVEITVGTITGSIALTADGWHMATHVGALGLASVAYWAARRWHGHGGFSFGTGKIHAIAGYTSAILLAAVAIAMAVESVRKLATPGSIDFATSLPVAIVGLVVNLLSIWLLHGRSSNHKHHDHKHHDHKHHDHKHHDHKHHDHKHHDHKHHDHAHHDHNHRAAVLHVVADAFTSALAIVALLLGRHAGWWWADPAVGLVGAAVILQWSAGLLVSAGKELLLFESPQLLEQIVAIAKLHRAEVVDLHVWPLGSGRKACTLTLVVENTSALAQLKAAVVALGISHITIETRIRASDS